PNASFGFSPAYGDAPLTETFTNSSSGATTYLWDFGDSTPTSNDTTPTHIFYNRGNFQVMLIATSSNGCMDTIIKNIYVIKPTLDLAVTDVRKSGTSNFISVSARLHNFGNRDINSFRISTTLENSLPVFENWTGLFPPGLFPAGIPLGYYNFTANFEISPDNPPHYLCVEATNPNNEADDNPANDILCINLSEDFVIIDPYPNPSSDVINLAFIAPHKDQVVIEIFDALGKLVREVYNGSVSTGLNKFVFDSGSLNQATYFCRFSFTAKTFVRPLTHISKNK
ncbi:MAG: T9SS type A sorting domain-containing protein, partial [Bacteroidia bacterium]|nr:T9SS type A sorting domain-containing protein [Bacteroidia bacterium]